MWGKIIVCRKHTNKVVLAPSAKAGNGTVTVSQLKYSDTEFYQRGANGDYVQENGYK